MLYETQRNRVKKPKTGMIRSRNNFPQPVKYNGVEIVMNPRGATMKDIVFELLENPLPKGLVFIQN